MTLISQPAPSALRDPEGNFIPPGTVHKRYEHNPMWDEEPVPSWITSGTGTYVTPTAAGSPYGGFEIVSDAGNSQIAFGPDIPRTPYLAASAMTFRGVRSLSAPGTVDSHGRHSVSMRFSTGNNDSTDRGASLASVGFTAHSSPPSGSTRLRAFYNGNDVLKSSLHRYYDPATGGGLFNGATMCLLVHWQLGMVYAFEGDFETGDCVNVVAAPGIIRYEDENPVRPRATISHQGASGTETPAPLRIAGVQVDHWYF